MRLRYATLIASSTILLFGATFVSAWSGPPGAPTGCPSGYVGCDSPLNVGPTAQVKNGNIAVNGLVVFGNTLLGGGSGSNAYLNFGGTAGSGGYGFRDNAGSIEYKNSSGAWTAFGSSGSISGTGTAGYIPRWTSTTALGNSTLLSDGISATSNGNFYIGGSSTVFSSDGQLVMWSDNANSYIEAHNYANTIKHPILINAWGGSVGINVTTTPTAQLQIGNNVGTAGTANQIQLYNSGGAIYGFGISANALNLVASGNTVFYNTGAPAFTVTSSGVIANSSVTSPQYCIGASCITSWPSGGGLTGGTTNYVPRWTSATSLGNSTITSDGVSSTATGNFFINSGNAFIPSGTLTMQNNLTLTGNQAYTTSGSLYLQYNAPANSSVTIGDGTNNHDLIINNGKILFNGSAGPSGVGNVTRGWYMDGTNLAARYPGTNGAFYVQDVPASVNYIVSGALVGGTIFQTGNVTVTNNIYAAAFLYTSDERLKKDVKPLTGNLNKVLALQPVSYHWINPASPQGNQIGFIAQQVQKIEPELVYTNASTSMEAVDYSRMSPLLVGSVQELNQKIEGQQKQIDQQQQEIDELQSEIKALQNK